LIEHLIAARGGFETVLHNNKLKIDANIKEIIAEMTAWRKETTACQEGTGACLESKEPTSLEIESVAVHEEARKEEAAVKPIRALKKRHGNRHLVVGGRGQAKKESQGNGGSRKKLVAACRGMIRSAIPARRKAHGRQDKVARETPKGRTFRKTRRAKPEGITGIRNQGSKQKPHLGSRTTLGRIFRKTAELEVAKQIVETSIRLRKMSDWTLWRSRTRLKRKKRQHTEKEP
jgi:phage protein D